MDTLAAGYDTTPTPDPDIRRARSTVWNLHARLVFATKYRQGVFDDAMLALCGQVLRRMCADFGVELREFNGEADHVHLLIHYPPTIALSRLVNSLKGVSSRILRKDFTGPNQPGNHARTTVVVARIPGPEGPDLRLDSQVNP